MAQSQHPYFALHQRTLRQRFYKFSMDQRPRVPYGRDHFMLAIKRFRDWQPSIWNPHVAHDSTICDVMRYGSYKFFITVSSKNMLNNGPSKFFTCHTRGMVFELQLPIDLSFSIPYTDVLKNMAAEIDCFLKAYDEFFLDYT